MTGVCGHSQMPWDVLVVGGGPAGSVAALVLARAGRRVLIAHASPGGPRIGEVIPPGAFPLLRDLGLLPTLADGHLPCPAIASAWGSDDLHVRDAIFNIYGRGWHLDRPRFDAALRGAAAAAGAQLLDGARVNARLRPGGPHQEAVVRTQAGESVVTCRWIVDTSGRTAAVATARGAARLSRDRLVAFHARFAPGPVADDDPRTLIEACAQGWWYSVLLPSRERVAAFLTDADLVDRGVMRSPAGWIDSLSRTTHLNELMWRHACPMIQRPRGADASSSRLDRVSGPHWIAAGDAAITFDPLSSQGLFNALYTGMAAGRAVDAALDGDGTLVVAYGTRIDEIERRYRHNLAAAYAGEARWTGQPFWRRRHLPDASPRENAR
jgi:flavin-dependent dehydrogenase